jgi:hypothetical protein
MYSQPSFEFPLPSKSSPHAQANIPNMSLRSKHEHPAKNLISLAPPIRAYLQPAIEKNDKQATVLHQYIVNHHSPPKKKTPP